MSKQWCAACGSTAVVKDGMKWPDTPIEEDKWKCLNCENKQLKEALHEMVNSSPNPDAARLYLRQWYGERTT